MNTDTIDEIVSIADDCAATGDEKTLAMVATYFQMRAQAVSRRLSGLVQTASVLERGAEQLLTSSQKATDYVVGNRNVENLDGSELIEFAGVNWRVDSVYETATGNYRVTAKFEKQNIIFDLPLGTAIVVLLAGEESR